MGTAGAPGVVRSRRAVRSRSASSTTARSRRSSAFCLSDVVGVIHFVYFLSSRVLSLPLDSGRQHIVMSVPTSHRQPCDEHEDDLEQRRTLSVVSVTLQFSHRTDSHGTLRTTNPGQTAAQHPPEALSEFDPQNRKRNPFATPDVNSLPLSNSLLPGGPASPPCLHPRRHSSTCHLGQAPKYIATASINASITLRRLDTTSRNRVALVPHRVLI